MINYEYAEKMLEDGMTIKEVAIFLDCSTISIRRKFPRFVKQLPRIDIKKVEKLNNKGLNPKEIANEIGCSITSVYNILERLGLDFGKIKKEQKEYAIQSEYAQGLIYKQRGKSLVLEVDLKEVKLPLDTSFLEGFKFNQYIHPRTNENQTYFTKKIKNVLIRVSFQNYEKFKEEVKEIIDIYKERL